MTRGRALALVLAVVLAVALGPAALAGPDPHGHGGGKDGPGGKPSPTPTTEPSSSPSPLASTTPTPEPTVTDPQPGDPTKSSSPAAAPTTSDAPGGGGGSGIVKLDRRPFDHAPNNEPHVGCTFQVDFYNYPEGGLTARYSFALWAPTGHAELKSGSIRLEDDPAGGGLDLDGEETIELGPALLGSGAAPHQHNGWHVKLVVHARHSSGPDQKQKVFWVRECKAPSTTEPPTVAPTTVTPPGPIAFTGSEIARLGAFGLLALVLGSGALWASTRLRRERP